jgi:hypothetical protein
LWFGKGKQGQRDANFASRFYFGKQDIDKKFTRRCGQVNKDEVE